MWFKNCYDKKWPPPVVSSQDACELVQKFLSLVYLLRLFGLQEEKRFGKKTWHRNVKMMGGDVDEFNMRRCIKKYIKRLLPNDLTMRDSPHPSPSTPLRPFMETDWKASGQLCLFSLSFTQMGENSNRGAITWWAMTRSFIHVGRPSRPPPPPSLLYRRHTSTSTSTLQGGLTRLHVFNSVLLSWRWVLKKYHPS